MFHVMSRVPASTISCIWNRNSRKMMTSAQRPYVPRSLGHFRIPVGAFRCPFRLLLRRDLRPPSSPALCPPHAHRATVQCRVLHADAGAALRHSAEALPPAKRHKTDATAEQAARGSVAVGLGAAVAATLSADDAVTAVERLVVADVTAAGTGSSVCQADILIALQVCLVCCRVGRGYSHRVFGRGLHFAVRSTTEGAWAPTCFRLRLGYSL